MSTGVVATWPWAGVQRWDGLWTIIFALVILWIAMVDELVHVARGNKPRYEKEPPKTTEEIVERAAQSGL